MMKDKCFYVLVLLFSAGFVVGQPVPGHKLYGYVTDMTDWGVVGVKVTVTGNESGLIWEGKTTKSGYFTNGYMSSPATGELFTAKACWGVFCGNESKRGLGAKTVFNVKVPTVVDRLKHKKGVRNVSISVVGASALLGRSSDLEVLVTNVGDFRIVGIYVSLSGVGADWNVSSEEILDLNPGESGVLSFSVSIPVEAVAGEHNLLVKAVFDGYTLEHPFVFLVEGACVRDVDCNLSFVCVGGVCELNRKCFNSVKDQGEFGVDCGGPCDACVVTTLPRPPLTTIPSITTLPKTTSSLSFLGSCFNGVLDVGEAGVDCGGSCPPCVVGRSMWAWVGGITVFIILLILLLVITVLWIKRTKTA